MFIKLTSYAGEAVYINADYINVIQPHTTKAYDCQTIVSVGEHDVVVKETCEEIRKLLEPSTTKPFNTLRENRDACPTCNMLVRGPHYCPGPKAHSFNTAWDNYHTKRGEDK